MLGFSHPRGEDGCIGDSCEIGYVVVVRGCVVDAIEIEEEYKIDINVG